MILQFLISLRYELLYENDEKFTSNHGRLANIHIEQHVFLVAAFF